MSIADKLTTIAENVPKVYKAGQKSMVDESKIIPKTVTGKRFVSVDDVSEVRHSVEIEATSGTELSVYDNSFIPSRAIKQGIHYTADGGTSSNVDIWVSYVKCNPNEQYTIECEDITNYVRVALCDKNQGFISRFMLDANNTKKTFTTTAETYYLQIAPNTAELEKTLLYQTQIDVIVSTEGKATIPSLSPFMTIVADSDVEITMNYRKSYGVQSEYDRFWDAYQENGNRTSYFNVFSGHAWNNEAFKPKYDIKPTNCYGLFWQAKITGDLDEILEECGVVLDTSKSNNFQNMFNSAIISVIGTIDTTNATSLSNTFMQTTGTYEYPKTIKLLKVKENGTTTFSNTFSNCQGLENITIEGTIGNNFDIHWSPLTHDSIMSIINHLQTKTSGTFTLTLGSTNLAKLTDAEKAIATEKGWTLA